MKHLLPLIIVLSSCTHKYYDGEGNRIPRKAVDLLVKSQFIQITTQEDSTLNKYFYFRLYKRFP